MVKHILILDGLGLNCCAETKACIESVGAHATLCHINRLPNITINHFDGIILPGGFSYGDHLGAAKVISQQLKHSYSGLLDDISTHKIPLLGICNGFQILCHLNYFDAPVTLMPNHDSRFHNAWVALDVCDHLFTMQAHKQVIMPIRHGAGNIQFDPADSDKIIPILKYQQFNNGSRDHIAGIRNHDGSVIGLMPHPEAVYKKELNPIDNETYGTTFFACWFNIIDKLKS